mmetsp:Transcript_41694/g.137362  ORF Transcript_41694/g.137362 Transcript_41694/m.137362 type:complete len:236 (-) Transcript_41694:382-1089(-)
MRGALRRKLDVLRFDHLVIPLAGPFAASFRRRRRLLLLLLPLLLLSFTHRLSRFGQLGRRVRRVRLGTECLGALAAHPRAEGEVGGEGRGASARVWHLANQVPVVPRQPQHVARGELGLERCRPRQAGPAPKVRSFRVGHREVVRRMARRVRVQIKRAVRRVHEHALPPLQLRKKVVHRVEMAGRHADSMARPQLQGLQRLRRGRLTCRVQPRPTQVAQLGFERHWSRLGGTWTN